ncbi:preprotein translocase subunit SecA [Desulfurivibrio dismutans]|uniref:preprotein translocase subunit SecA n=1 Tax=Desulfurivibrio dismutans TaxID=1398908 RepID=UPI0023DCB03C|nr:preprotein translocase subunit SecA [Desulfurivibrio alkaliphilus]MDF1615149.1 preprotein translocase subunit SecA [Desulfurivibrio alkaliphilus]
MLAKVLKKLFGSQNERMLKVMQPLVERINTLEPEMQALDDTALAAKTVEFRERLNQGGTLDDLLPEAFAVVREASRRVLQMRHFDVQLIGGVVLHQGRIAEMKTGEGKTLVATLAVYLNALTGRGVHVVTVNDYLARRDAEWMGRLYNFLGLSVGVVVPGVDDAARKEAYAADVTYGTNNEFGFDYLRDNMKFSLEDFCQRAPNFAIVDEVDSILIDEARTPLIISGPADVSTDLYVKVDTLIPSFQAGVHYTIDEKAKSVALTEEGVALGEELLGVENLYDPRNIEQLHHLNQALKAHVLFKRDVDYLVTDGQVVIVDEFTGRAMTGRRFSDGLHQALEAKEGVKVERENQTLASVTFQNYFRMYEKLAGMTGTADTEAAEFKKIYNLDVMVIPTHHPMVREDYPDAIYKTLAAKYRAIVREIKELHTAGQPVLVGTVSIDVSEKISAMLKKDRIPHAVLNAKQHDKEAEIVADAGQKGKVTIATNMAGRGTDIKLGEGVAELGGLHILGTSRHESRRIDNQLRGRSGRQGDLGSSRFFLSLEDDLLRVFGSDRISGIMDRLGMEEDEPIEHNMISKAIENAQRKVEGHNFEIRKHLLEYDDVMNKQREVIYGQRRELLESTDLKEAVMDMITEQVQALAADIGDANIPSADWDWQALEERCQDLFFFPLEWDEAAKSDLNATELESRLLDLVKSRYEEREAEIGVDNMRQLERLLLLQMVDNHWKEHLLNMDHLKEGIGLRGYGQKNPLIEYKREGFQMFREMIARMDEQTVRTLFRVRLVRSDDVEELEAQQRNRRQPMQLSRGEGGGEARARQPVTRQGDKVGRNAPCPCGSGKKHKRCCGRQ